MEPRVAWGQWPSWQFELLSTGLKEELEVLTNRHQEGDGKPDLQQRAERRAPDWEGADALLEGLSD